MPPGWQQDADCEGVDVADIGTSTNAALLAAGKEPHVSALATRPSSRQALLEVEAMRPDDQQCGEVLRSSNFDVSPIILIRWLLLLRGDF